MKPERAKETQALKKYPVYPYKVFTLASTGTLM